jgi:hypothetical protein
METETTGRIQQTIESRVIWVVFNFRFNECGEEWKFVLCLVHFFFLRILCYDGNLMHQVPNVSDVAPSGYFFYIGRSRATLPIFNKWCVYLEITRSSCVLCLSIFLSLRFFFHRPRKKSNQIISGWSRPSIWRPIDISQTRFALLTSESNHWMNVCFLEVTIPYILKFPLGLWMVAQVI